MREILDEQGKDCKVQIYSTDLADDVIAIARKGFYPPNIAADVSALRLKMFFIREEKGYQVKKEIREMIIYATQNIIKDPPFTKLDLLSCRNLLIYIESDIQSKLISTFHYAHNPGGILLLSSFESIGSATVLFRPIGR
ncbi:MAG: CheR family methyltransferase, partial [Methanobacteriota archaeon]